MNDMIIDTREFTPKLARVVELPDGSRYTALWLDDLTPEVVEQMRAAEEKANDTFAVFAAATESVRLMMPDLPEDKRRRLKIRELLQLAAALKQYEFVAAAQRTETAGPLPETPNP